MSKKAIAFSLMIIIMVVGIIAYDTGKGEAVSHSVVKQEKPMVAFTFDDGPCNNDAPSRILDTLERYNARATFFMIGENALEHPDNLKRKVNLCMEIGNHTYDHNHFGKAVTPSDIQKASDAIYDACGMYPTAFRSPGGSTTYTILDECKKENMALYHWSIDTMDWKYKDADRIYKTVMESIDDGDIVLMHEIYPTTADAIERIIPALIKKGYRIVTCKELVEAKTGKPPQAGKQYINATQIFNITS